MTFKKAVKRYFQNIHMSPTIFIRGRFGCYRFCKDLEDWIDEKGRPANLTEEMKDSTEWELATR